MSPVSKECECRQTFAQRSERGRCREREDGDDAERIPEFAENDVRVLWSGSLVLRVLLTPAQAHTTDFWYSARADY